MAASDNENQYEYGSETDGEEQQQQVEVVPSQPAKQGQRTMQRARQNRPQAKGNNPLPQYTTNNQQLTAQQNDRITGNMGGRTGAIRESRIKDRPVPQETRDSSLKIKIELDLEVEVDLYARVKGDVTIGLM
jgi:hypothetical protein